MDNFTFIFLFLPPAGAFTFNVLVSWVKTWLLLSIQKVSV